MQITTTDRHPLQLSFFDTQHLVDHINESLNPESYLIYRGRQWRLSRPILSRDGEFIAGRLGFQTVDLRHEMAYNEDTFDFEKREAPPARGTLIHYIVHYPSGRIAVETNKDISQKAARAVLEKFFNKPYSPRKYRVEFIPDMTFDEWVSEVREIKTLQVRIDRPNPNWSALPGIGRRIIRPSNAQHLDVVLRATATQPLNLDNEEIEDLTAYSISHGQGVSAESTRGRRYNTKTNAKNRRMPVDEDDIPRRRFMRLLDLFQATLPDETDQHEEAVQDE